MSGIQYGLSIWNTVAGIIGVWNRQAIVELSEVERGELEALISGGTLGARTMKRALILLRSDDGWTAEEVGEAVNSGVSTVYRRRQRYVEVGLPEALHDHHRVEGKRKLSALQEATLVACLRESTEGSGEMDDAAARRRTRRADGHRRAE